MTNGISDFPATSKSGNLKLSGTDLAWDALDRFINELQDKKQHPDQFETALNAIGEATSSEIVFLYNDLSGRVTEVVGSRRPPAQWCRDVLNRITADLPKGGIWKSPEPPAGAPRSEPFSAALLRVDAPGPGWLVVLRSGANQPLQISDLRFIRVIWRLQAGHSRHAQVYDNLKDTLFGIIRCLSTAIDAKDPYTCGHSERVARITVRLGEEMGLSRGEISDLYLAGLLHDVGKIGIRDEVLCKPGPLTPEEFAHIQEHPVTGDRIIANVTRLAYLRPGVRGHHEQYDGSGYPDGLVGENIPLMARLIAVADGCDAMMSARRYRAALPQAKIEKIFREGAGKQWDPQIVDLFFACRHELYAVYQRGLGQSVYMAVERAAEGGASDSGLIRPNPFGNKVAHSL